MPSLSTASFGPPPSLASCWGALNAPPGGLVTTSRPFAPVLDQASATVPFGPAAIVVLYAFPAGSSSACENEPPGGRSNRRTWLFGASPSTTATHRLPCPSTANDGAVSPGAWSAAGGAGSCAQPAACADALESAIAATAAMDPQTALFISPVPPVCV